MNNSIISDDMFSGAYDADGSFLIIIDSYLNKKTCKQPFGINLKYDFAQSNSKKDLVKKMAQKFGLSTRTDAKDTSFRVGVNSLEGQKMRLFFLNNKPLYPNHLYDFLLSEVILKLLQQGAQFTTSGLVTLINLAHKNSFNLKTNKRKQSIDFWLGHIKPTPKELEEGQEKAKLALEQVNQEVALLKSTLPTKVLSLDYIRGAHYGDGGLTVSLSWKPTKADRLRTEPEWTISGENKEYCEAFVYNLGGDVNSSGPNCRKFRCSGIQNCAKMLYIFEEKNIFIPEYKALQFAKFKEAIRMLVAKEHLTEQGVVALVSLVYDMSEKGQRSYKKEEYIEWGLDWVRRHTK